MGFLQNPDTALIVVDVQNDFLPGGALPVPQGDAVIAPINRLIRVASTVVLTADWHPAEHQSFAASHPDRHPFDVIDMFMCDKDTCNLLHRLIKPSHRIQYPPAAHPGVYQKRPA